MKTISTCRPKTILIAGILGASLLFSAQTAFATDYGCDKVIMNEGGFGTLISGSSYKINSALNEVGKSVTLLGQQWKVTQKAPGTTNSCPSGKLVSAAI